MTRYSPDWPGWSKPENGGFWGVTGRRKCNDSWLLLCVFHILNIFYSYRFDMLFNRSVCCPWVSLFSVNRETSHQSVRRIVFSLLATNQLTYSFSSRAATQTLKNSLKMSLLSLPSFTAWKRFIIMPNWTWRLFAAGKKFFTLQFLELFWLVFC